ncbi:MAG: AMP-binding protein, partial [Proteobacteria bacterium]|nr:AMP-binding protein [Pseudomonadota bacterium]
AGRFEVGGDDVVLLVLPLAHIYSLNVGLGTSITVGATMVLLERFDPAEALEVIARHRVSVVLGAPPMYVAWLESGLLEEADTSSVRLAVSGAAPPPAISTSGSRLGTSAAAERGVARPAPTGGPAVHASASTRAASRASGARAASFWR